jgi:hypothetical protein
MENTALTYNEVDDLRKVMGTLPSERPTKRTDLKTFEESVEITLEDHSANPYKAMFVTSTSTWGTNEFKQKWPDTTLKGKLEVVKAVLTHNTLPQAKEMVQFVFRVKGVPRWLFDYHCTSVQFISFMSIGCRDNNKIDSDVVHSSESEFAQQHDKDVFAELKDLYEIALSDSQGSWQTARSFLPQSYSHAYHFGQNLLSIVGTRGFHASKKFDMTNYKDVYLSKLYEKVIAAVREKFALLGLYLELLHAPDNEVVMQKLLNFKVEDLTESDKNLFNTL